MRSSKFYEDIVWTNAIKMNEPKNKLVRSETYGEMAD